VIVTVDAICLFCLFQCDVEKWIRWEGVGLMGVDVYNGGPDDRRFWIGMWISLCGLVIYMCECLSFLFSKIKMITLSQLPVLQKLNDYTLNFLLSLVDWTELLHMVGET
jgi:hypothetical protein